MAGSGCATDDLELAAGAERCGGTGTICPVSASSGQVPRGLRLTFVVLTVLAVAVAVAAATREVWFVVVIAGLMAVANLGILWITRSRHTSPS